MIDDPQAGNDAGTTENNDIPVQTSSPEPLVVAREEPAEPETQDERAAPQQAEAPSAERKPVPKLPDWAQKKIADAEFERREANRKAKALEEELASLRTRQPGQQQTTADDHAAANANAPAGGYRTEADFDAAVEAAAVRREQQARAIEAQQRFDAACNTAYNAGKQAFGADFDAAVENLRHVGAMNRDVLDVIMETGAPEKVLFDLGNDPDKAASLMAMSPAKRVIEIAKLAVAAPEKKAPTPLSRAPRPVEPVEGSARVSGEPRDEDDDATWFAKRDAQLAARYRGVA